MDSWCYVAGEKAVVSNEMISSCDTFERSKNSIMGWDFKAPFNFGNNFLVSDQQGLDNQDLEELGFQELIGKQTPDSSDKDSLSRKVYGGKLINPLMGIPNAFPIGDESNSRISSSVVDSNCMGSSFIDLNLGRVADLGDAQNSKISHGIAFLSSSVSSNPLKKARIGVNSHAAYCQVYGCHKDLSSSKEYHKRHKVCEVHSKTAKVIVNGIEQRFCQQCSRFHLLAEFDDGKRSCHKRLAGHNQRRRKPQAGIHTGRTAAFLQSYNGTAGGRFHGNSGMATSFICHDLLPGGILNHGKYGANDWRKKVKVEDGNDFSPLSTGPFAREQHLYSKPLFPSNNFEKLLPTFHESGASRASSEAEQYPQEFGYLNSRSRSLMQDFAPGSEDFFPFGSAANIQGSSEITDSGCARSLLSSQSQSSSSPSSIKHMASQLLVPGRCTHYSVGQVAEKLVGINNSQASSSSGVSNRFSSSAEGMHMSSIMISDSAEAVNFDSMDRIYQGSQYSSANDRVSYEDDTTMNLLQLSSQLQRVEHQKQSMSEKQGSDAFYCSRIT